VTRVLRRVLAVTSLVFGLLFLMAGFEAAYFSPGVESLRIGIVAIDIGLGLCLWALGVHLTRTRAREPGSR
jgi:hypothetical protein